MIRMCACLLSAALLAAPAFADACQWGNSIKSEAVGSTTDDGGAVTIHNRLTCCHDNVTVCSMPIDGVGDVTVEWSHGAGDIPDEIEVTPPFGWRAEPPAIVVPEGGAAIINILPELVG